MKETSTLSSSITTHAYLSSNALQQPPMFPLWPLPLLPVALLSQDSQPSPPLPWMSYHNCHHYLSMATTDIASTPTSRTTTRHTTIASATNNIISSATTPMITSLLLYYSDFVAFTIATIPFYYTIKCHCQHPPPVLPTYCLHLTPSPSIIL